MDDLILEGVVMLARLDESPSGHLMIRLLA